MRFVALCALLGGCTPIGKGNCVETEYYVGPAVAGPRIGTNGSHIVVAWSQFVEGDEDPAHHASVGGALFDPGGQRVAGSEFALEWPYVARSFTGGTDRALVTGPIEDYSTHRSFVAIQRATGEVLAPVETSIEINGGEGVFEGSSFLVATQNGAARLSLDGVITEEIALGRSGGALVAGATVSWMLWRDTQAVTGVRIARGGAVLDATPRLIAEGDMNRLAAARGDEVAFAALKGDMLTWTVLGASGVATTTTSTTTAPVGEQPYEDAYPVALVAETDGYLMIIENNTVDSTALGMMRISPAGVAGPYVPLGFAKSTDAIALGGRTMVVYARAGVLRDTPAIDAIVVDSGAEASAPITVETTTGGHVETNECGAL